MKKELVAAFDLVGLNLALEKQCHLLARLSQWKGARGWGVGRHGAQLHLCLAHCGVWDELSVTYVNSVLAKALFSL